MSSETDFQLAMRRNHEMVARGLHEQFVAGLLPPSTSTTAVMTVLRQQLRMLVVRVGQRLQSKHAVTRDSLDTIPTAERGAIA